MGSEIGVASPVVDATGDGNEASDLLSQDGDGVNGIPNVHTPEVSSITPSGHSFEDWPAHRVAVHDLNKTTSKVELPIGDSGTGIEIKSGD
jgi:hypothetical protein